MKATITSEYMANADKVWALVKRSDTLIYITKGIFGYSGAENFPLEWQQGKVERIRLLFFGVVPGWEHQISFVQVDDNNRILYTNECGGVISTWNHLIEVKPLSSSKCRYIDTIEIKAGIFTPLIWLYAHLFFGYRQFRWRYLLAS